MQLDVDDCQLHVEVDGPDDAPAVLLWNGVRCTLRQWDLVVPKLLDRYRLLRFDVRATGDHNPNLEYSREVVERVQVHDWWSWRMSVMAQYYSDLISQSRYSWFGEDLRREH